jgi:hypothetical protein
MRPAGSIITGARNYDPYLVQFTGADDALDGPNAYSYTGDTPTTASDPSGHRRSQATSTSSAHSTGERIPPVNQLFRGCARAIPPLRLKHGDSLLALVEQVLHCAA